MKEEEATIGDRTIKMRKYVGQDPNEQRMGGRVKPEDGDAWYGSLTIPEKGVRKLKKSILKRKK